MQAALSVGNPDCPLKVPFSKSIGARYLMASFIGGTLDACPEFDDSDDLRVMQGALRRMAESADAPTTCGIDVHASGTALRFVTALAASLEGRKFRISGTPRLCARPMLPLLEVLKGAGALVEGVSPDGTGPYIVEGEHLKGGEFEIAGNISSQFISALMLVAPMWENGLILRFTTTLVSRPYVEMTAAMMRSFGIAVTLGRDEVRVAPGRYLVAPDYRVEADWSAAAFFYEGALLGEREMVIDGVLPPGESLQGDAATADIFNLLGVRSEFTPAGVRVCKGYAMRQELAADLSRYPDLVPALAVGCCLAGVRYRFKGIANLRLKESDRIAALQNELRKLGFVAEGGADRLEWRGERCEAIADAVIDTYDDHRIAMAFAMGALSLGCIRIRHPEVVAKSFENFWEEMATLGLRLRKEGDVMIVEKLTAC